MHIQMMRVTADLTEAGMTHGLQTDLHPEAVEVAVGAAEDLLVAEAEAVVVVAEALSKVRHSVEAAVEVVDVAEVEEAVVEVVGVEAVDEGEVVEEEDSEVEGGRASLDLE